MNMMEKISFYGALFGAKIALKISSNFLSFLSKYCKKDIVTVTGTNGKTTTSGLLAHILKMSDNTVLHNEKGANMLSGIASSLAVNYKPFSSFDYAVLESDEAYLTKLYDYLKADYLLVTNLFRDQLDRYGELDTTAKKIQEAVTKNPQLKLFINADDPMLLELGKDNKRIYFGFDNITYKNSIQESQAPAEAVYCPCGSDLFYEKRYSQTVLDDGEDFCMVAKGLGCEAFRVTTKEEFDEAIRKAIELKKPVVLDCMIGEDDKVFPMVPAGAPISEAFDASDMEA